ncbi:RNA polymerase sigma-32 factor [Candidatus Kinetoplastibacterium blastocrithidii TCC012E]|uniref:RNA polymerase sigma factor n=1 Tax=Candidatus Kinetoplastidibacterium blastocrithidiae TCC012E TaxID=1208922 RepID=M1LZJ3_9PROT|nr:RNA polymerase sigma factor RpoH [Candidatus Kinetoplastibacterium blastocrithidii]AFZ83388.1 RNA polymerase sigma-32 factor [Candidatus Kinetoplastibacterium blastocrithidii (ex Strigomonas culicis)]AGF49486.1 RNA polymerase sigma-32 factor [Candidatus Kinetoplastibacterium blastocrithidii TCC012E]
MTGSKGGFLTHSSSTSVVLDSFSLSGVGTIESYIANANRMPVLSADREVELARCLRDTGDLGAAKELVLSHLRLVISIARQYLGYGLPHADLIQEGNIGLMKAIRRFDPERGVRLMSFAVHWIKAEIHEFVIRNWRLVKIATTKAQRKIFFNLRSMRSNGNYLDSAQIDKIASSLNVRCEDIREMEIRLSGSDIPIESREDDDDGYYPAEYLFDSKDEPDNILNKRDYDLMQSTGLKKALEVLDGRSRKIVESRWLQDESNHTLQELADEFGISAERVRQIESAAMKKMKKFLLK